MKRRIGQRWLREASRDDVEHYVKTGETRISKILLQQSRFKLRNKKRNIPLMEKTTSPNGKRDYMKLYMRIRRNEKKERS